MGTFSKKEGEKRQHGVVARTLARKEETWIPSLGLYCGILASHPHLRATAPTRTDGFQADGDSPSPEGEEAAP